MSGSSRAVRADGLPDGGRPLPLLPALPGASRPPSPPPVKDTPKKRQLVTAACEPCRKRKSKVCMVYLMDTRRVFVNKSTRSALQNVQDVVPVSVMRPNATMTQIQPNRIPKP